VVAICQNIGSMRKQWEETQHIILTITFQVSNPRINYTVSQKKACDYIFCK